jgi:hypothetical protein
MPVRVEIKNFMDQQLRILAPWTRDISACQVFLELETAKSLDSLRESNYINCNISTL